MQQSTEITLKLPNLSSLTCFNWAGCNPHYSFSDRTSTQWMLNYGTLSEYKSGRLNMTHIELLGAYTYPYADANELRIANDMLTILTTLDEYTDGLDGNGVKTTRDTFASAQTGRAGGDTSPVTRFTKDFLDRLSHVPTELRNRLATSFIEYLDATANEASLRTDGKLPTFEEYVRVRRRNGGIFPCFNTIEIALGIVLPEEVREDGNFQNIVLAANDLMSLSNDIYSYAAEYARGLDGMNAVTILMDSEGLSQQEAMDRAAEIYKNRVNDMMTLKASIRSFGQDNDEMVRSYVYGLEQWVQGNNAWSLDTPRFFGEDREEVKRTFLVRLNQRNSIP